MAGEAVFVDTNVLIYAVWNGASRHFEARSALGALISSGASLHVSRQVFREFLAVATRPQGDVVPMAVSEAVQTVDAFEKLFVVIEDTTRIGRRHLDLIERYDVKGRVIHDANIVASMLDAGVRRLLTANPSDFRRFAGIIDIEPL